MKNDACANETPGLSLNSQQPLTTAFSVLSPNCAAAESIAPVRFGFALRSALAHNTLKRYVGVGGRCDMADDEQKLFSLTEAERLRVQLEPVLIEAMESRRKMAEVEEQLRDIAERISRSGGMLVNYEKTAKIRLEFNRLQQSVQSALDRIHETGCVVKDLNVGLLDFPARIDGDEVYLCWKLGEDRIRFYHRQDEGFAGRKPIDPRDAGYSNPVQ